jgi:hypothetical protein
VCYKRAECRRWWKSSIGRMRGRRLKWSWPGNKLQILSRIFVWKLEPLESQRRGLKVLKIEVGLVEIRGRLTFLLFHSLGRFFCFCKNSRRFFLGPTMSRRCIRRGCLIQGNRSGTCMPRLWSRWSCFCKTHSRHRALDKSVCLKWGYRYRNHHSNFERFLDKNSSGFLEIEELDCNPY